MTAPLTATDLRIRLASLLARACQQLPATLPKGYDDSAIAPLLDTIDEVDNLLAEVLLPVEQRDRDHKEDERLRRIRIREAKLEDLIMRFDHRVGGLAHMIALKAPVQILRGEFKLLMQCVIDIASRAAPEVWSTEEWIIEDRARYRLLLALAEVMTNTSLDAPVSTDEKSLYRQLAEQDFSAELPPVAAALESQRDVQSAAEGRSGLLGGEA